MQQIVIDLDDPTTPAARRLVAQLDAYLADLYPAESNHLLSVEALRDANVTFLTARVEEEVVGCGAFVDHQGEYAELKRIFVVPEFRGLRIGHRIVQELEARVRSAGLRLIRLEAGVFQPEALGLYERTGYARRGPFGAYDDDPLSVFMEKQLD